MPQKGFSGKDDGPNKPVPKTSGKSTTGDLWEKKVGGKKTTSIEGENHIRSSRKASHQPHQQRKGGK